MNNNDISRRDLLKGSAVAAMGLAAGGAIAVTPSRPSGAGGQAAFSPDRKLRFGIIGCGGKGWSGMEQASEFGDIVALVDIDSNNRNKAIL